MDTLLEMLKLLGLPAGAWTYGAIGVTGLTVIGGVIKAVKYVRHYTVKVGTDGNLIVEAGKVHTQEIAQEFVDII